MIKPYLDFFVFDSIPNRYKTHEMCNSIISEDPFSVRFVPDQYNTQQMCDKTADDCPAALKFVPNWFITSKMIKKLFTDLCTDGNILYFNEDSGNIKFSYNEIGIVTIDLHNINLDDTNYEEDDPDTVTIIRIGLGILAQNT